MWNHFPEIDSKALKEYSTLSTTTTTTTTTTTQATQNENDDESDSLDEAYNRVGPLTLNDSNEGEGTWDIFDLFE